MVKLISLELRRNSLRAYNTAIIISAVVLLSFLYLMAAIPYIDPVEADGTEFSSYVFLTGLEQIVSMAVFSILGAVMGARFIVEEYSGKRALLLFSYPVSRKKVMKAKLWLTFIYPSAAMFFVSVVISIIFFLTESFFPLCADSLTLETLLWTFASLTSCSLLAGALGVLSVWIGFLKGSVPTAITASVIAASLAAQALSVSFNFRPTIFIILGAAATAGGAAIKSMLERVESMEV